MRRLAVVSVLLIAGCAGAPQQPNGMAVAVPPRATPTRPWLVPRPSDQMILFDTRMLQALRELDEIEALNANGSGRVTRPWLWFGIGLSALAVVVVEDARDDSGPCVDFANCQQP